MLRARGDAPRRGVGARDRAPARARCDARSRRWPRATSPTSCPAWTRRSSRRALGERKPIALDRAVDQGAARDAAGDPEDRRRRSLARLARPDDDTLAAADTLAQEWWTALVPPAKDRDAHAAGAMLALGVVARAVLRRGVGRADADRGRVSPHRDRGAAPRAALALPDRADRDPRAAAHLRAARRGARVAARYVAAARRARARSRGRARRVPRRHHRRAADRAAPAARRRAHRLGAAARARPRAPIRRSTSRPRCCSSAARARSRPAAPRSRGRAAAAKAAPPPAHLDVALARRAGEPDRRRARRGSRVAQGLLARARRRTASPPRARAHDGRDREGARRRRSPSSHGAWRHGGHSRRRSTASTRSRPASPPLPRTGSTSRSSTCAGPRAVEPGNAKRAQSLAVALGRSGQGHEAIRVLAAHERNDAPRLIGRVLVEAGRYADAVPVLRYASRRFRSAEDWALARDRRARAPTTTPSPSRPAAARSRSARPIPTLLDGARDRRSTGSASSSSARRSRSS